MTNNFENYKEFIKLQCPNFPVNNDNNNNDVYYVIELMRRGKDNPGLSAANYHFKNYYIYSYKDLERYETEIKKLCEIFNMRAYASINWKSSKQVALNTVAEMTRRIANGDYKKFYSIYESESGKYTSRSNSLWVVDIDNVDLDNKEDLDKINTIASIINDCDNAYQDCVIEFKFKTKSGLHYVTHPFNKKQFAEKMYEHKLSADIKENHLTLLYENL